MTIVVSGGDFKVDSLMWWSKAVRLARALGFNREHTRSGITDPTSPALSPTCRSEEIKRVSFSSLERQEERRRTFWLLFCLDRHLALSFNSPLTIWDDECGVFTPLPEKIWEALESAPVEALYTRTYGPPTLVTGTGFFEYFLPLMAILGDIVQLHHRTYHPRIGVLDHRAETAFIESTLVACARSISDMENRYNTNGIDGTIPGKEFLAPNSVLSENSTGQLAEATSPRLPTPRAQAQLVTAYGTFILHVLHVLLHGKWDAVSMLDNEDGWITSSQFMKCASHAISASKAVSQILRCDPELTFMPYLFGIYLLHGSFILLLFADRMPQLGPNESVEEACETIIRAHEVCVVTLSTEFQVRTLAPFCSIYILTRATIRSAFAKYFARRSIAFEAQVSQTTTKANLVGGLFHSIDGQEELEAWRCRFQPLCHHLFTAVTCYGG